MKQREGLYIVDAHIEHVDCEHMRRDGVVVLACTFYDRKLRAECLENPAGSNWQFLKCSCCLACG